MDLLTLKLPNEGHVSVVTREKMNINVWDAPSHGPLSGEENALYLHSLLWQPLARHVQRVST